MTTAEFWDRVLTSRDQDISRLRDADASEFVLKMAALGETVSFRMDQNLEPCAETSFGQYRFCLDSLGTRLVVDQVL